MKSATITIRFRVQDEARLTQLADQAIERHGGGVEVDKDSPLASRILELLLNSNPDIKSYLDYGIELTDTQLEDTVTQGTKGRSARYAKGEPLFRQLDRVFRANGCPIHGLQGSK